jgi:hypothetical protein
MIRIGPTSPLRLHAALKHVLSLVARTECHEYLPLAGLIDRTARQLDKRTWTEQSFLDPNSCRETRRHSHHRLETKLQPGRREC